jgi:hypothetical protein
MTYGLSRANEVFEERRTDSLICDSCMEEIKKGEAFLSVYRDNLAVRGIGERSMRNTEEEASPNTRRLIL